MTNAREGNGRRDMEEVKRFGSMGDCHEIDTINGRYVLYTDYSALYSEMGEQCRLLAMGAEREARLKSRVAELERERDHNASLVDEGDNLTMQESARADLLAEVLKNCDLEIHRLRAQLEAARFRVAELEEELNVASDKLVCDRCGKIGFHRCLPAQQNICAHAQLTAQPDGGREEAKASAWTAYFAIRSALDDLDRALQDQALAAPAPAPEGAWIPDDGPGSFNGARFVTPAPAKVCQTCGDEKYVFHELDLSKPCPDCAKEGKK